MPSLPPWYDSADLDFEEVEELDEAGESFLSEEENENAGFIPGVFEDADFDQSSLDEDEEEYDSEDLDYEEDEEVSEAAAFAQA